MALPDGSVRHSVAPMDRDHLESLTMVAPASSGRSRAADRDGVIEPLRACLLSGGGSRRMGVDKAMLPHPAGGSWLAFSLERLAELEIPLTLLSHHGRHRGQARAMAAHGSAPVDVLDEPAPREGPLLALLRLLRRYPGERLLLCPVDMPWLNRPTLEQLLVTSGHDPRHVHLAHDGRRLQPLLGVYPSDLTHREALRAFVADGGRSLLGWLDRVDAVAVPLDPMALRNANHPADLARLWSAPWREAGPRTFRHPPGAGWTP